MALILFIILFFLYLPAGQSHQDFFVVWNVGQGQWVSFINQERCIHIDIGGEFAPWQKIQQNCGKKENHLYLTHGDWDHISFIRKSLQRLYRLRLCQAPKEKLSLKKQNILNLLTIKTCPDTAQQLKFKLPRSKTFDANTHSAVYLYKKILIPGDSTKKAEYNWSGNKKIKNIDYLVLGHHGSNTSTGERLLRRLPKVKLAISSARKKKYGHPHKNVKQRLKKYRIPLLRTEDWGNIFIELPLEF